MSTSYKYSEVLIRYGELSTKKKNRKQFTQQLAENMRHVLHDYPNIKIYAHRDRMNLALNGTDYEVVKDKIAQVFGIQSFSPVLKVPLNIDALMEGAAQLFTFVDQPMTFKINARRAYRDFPWDTPMINKELGAFLLKQYPQLTVSVKHPEIELKVEVRHEGIYLSYETCQGKGGLPVGTSGKGMLMLSGGIDSPVAGYLAMKRGIRLYAVHFHSPPYTSEQALYKAKQLAEKLTLYGGDLLFITVPFTHIQEQIKQHIPSSYLMTITRRMMLRITDQLREKYGALAIINGESLGQVASQTMHSMYAINEVTSTPVLRPLITMDKTEIIKIAETIDTFHLSIQPYEDCCTIFTPPQPKTKPQLDRVLSYETALNVDQLVEEAVQQSIEHMIHLGDQFNDHQTLLERELEELL